MANETIYSNPVSYLSWDSNSSLTAITRKVTTVVTNSSGSTVYWTEGAANSGSIVNNGTLTCTKGAADLTWNFSTQSTGGPQITLTVTSSGGGAPPPAKPQGHGHGS